MSLRSAVHTAPSRIHGHGHRLATRTEGWFTILDVGHAQSDRSVTTDRSAHMHSPLIFLWTIRVLRSQTSLLRITGVASFMISTLRSTTQPVAAAPSTIRDHRAEHLFLQHGSRANAFSVAFDHDLSRHFAPPTGPDGNDGGVVAFSRFAPLGCTCAFFDVHLPVSTPRPLSLCVPSPPNSLFADLDVTQPSLSSAAAVLCRGVATCA